MRDPELLLCAQRAAARLENAWDRWRMLRGPGGGSAGEVSSYVGYSQNEPRGRPRVVVGVDADEAELLAALLDSGSAVPAPADAEAGAGAADDADASTGGTADGGVNADGTNANGTNGTGANGNGANGTGANGNGGYQGANGVRPEPVPAAEPEICEICGAWHTEDGSDEPEQPAPSEEPTPGPQPVIAQAAAGQPVPAQRQEAGAPASPAWPPQPPQYTAPMEPVPSQLAPGGRQADLPGAPAQAIPAGPVPVSAFPAQQSPSQQFPAQPGAAGPVSGPPLPGGTDAGPEGQGPARDSADAGDAAAAASVAGAEEPGATRSPRAGATARPRGRANQNGQDVPDGQQDDPADVSGDGADDWEASSSIPAELSGWASEALPSQAYAGLAAWVAACSEPDEQEAGSLSRSA